MSSTEKNTIVEQVPLALPNNLPDDGCEESRGTTSSRQKSKLQQLRDRKNKKEEIYNAALDYSKLDFPLIPIRSDTKKPSIITGKDHLEGATSDPNLIRELFLEGNHLADIGLVAGKGSGLVVIDIDGPDGLESLNELEDTLGPLPKGGPVARTPRDDGGSHLFFKYPHTGSRIKSRRIGGGLDIKADGGYVVVPPSNGRAWDVDISADILELPIPWLDFLAQDKIGLSSDSHAGGVGYIPVGDRNNSLFRTGCKLRSQGEDFDEILDQLIDLNRELCVEPLPNHEVVSIAKNISSYPIGDLGELYDDRLPLIRVTNGDVVSLSGDAWKALLLDQKNSNLFRNSTGLVRIKSVDKQGVEVETLDQDNLSFHLNRAAIWVNEKSGGLVPKSVPLFVVKDMLADPNPPLPVLDKVVTAPIVMDDGNIHSKPGYDSDSRCFYAPTNGLIVPKVSEAPSESDVGSARDLLLEAFCDFPFAGPEHDNPELAHAIALTIQPFARGAIKGPYPLIMLEAAAPGTGKSLGARVSLIPAIGEDVPIMAEGRNDEEWRKRLTAILMNYPMAVVIDNVKYALHSPVLAAVITASFWEDRILGKSKMVRLPVNCSFVATGNNPTFTSEISRRIVRIRLVAPSDRPWLREPSSFKHPDLTKWAVDNRGELIWACLTLIKNWFAMGKPAPSHGRSLGMFESWSSIMGGILEAAGINGFLGNLDDFYDSSDLEASQHRTFVAAWWEKLGDTQVGVANLFDLVAGDDPDVDLDLGTGGVRSQRIRLGKSLRKMKDQQFGYYKVHCCGAANNASLYYLEDVTS